MLLMEKNVQKNGFYSCPIYSEGVFLEFTCKEKVGTTLNTREVAASTFFRNLGYLLYSLKHVFVVFVVNSVSIGTMLAIIVSQKVFTINFVFIFNFKNNIKFTIFNIKSNINLITLKLPSGQCLRNHSISLLIMLYVMVFYHNFKCN